MSDTELILKLEQQINDCKENQNKLLNELEAISLDARILGVKLQIEIFQIECNRAHISLIKAHERFKS